MNRALRMLDVLKDGRWHSREDILANSPGGFFLTNNAASDLRNDYGHDVEFAIRDGLRCYRLVSLEEPSPNPSREATGGAWDGNGSSSESASPASAEVVAGSLHLFDVEAAA